MGIHQHKMSKRGRKHNQPKDAVYVFTVRDLQNGIGIAWCRGHCLDPCISRTRFGLVNISAGSKRGEASDNAFHPDGRRCVFLRCGRFAAADRFGIVRADLGIIERVLDLRHRHTQSHGCKGCSLEIDAHSTNDNNECTSAATCRGDPAARATDNQHHDVGPNAQHVISLDDDDDQHDDNYNDDDAQQGGRGHRGDSRLWTIHWWN